MNLFADIRTQVIADLNAMVDAGQLPADLSFDNVTVEPPRDASHGDMATNAAMVLAKPAGLKPRDIAMHWRHVWQQMIGSLLLKWRALVS